MNATDFSQNRLYRREQTQSAKYSLVALLTNCEILKIEILNRSHCANTTKPFPFSKKKKFLDLTRFSTLPGSPLTPTHKDLFTA